MQSFASYLKRVCGRSLHLHVARSHVTAHGTHRHDGRHRVGVHLRLPVRTVDRHRHLPLSLLRHHTTHTHRSALHLHGVHLIARYHIAHAGSAAHAHRDTHLIRLLLRLLHLVGGYRRRLVGQRQIREQVAHGREDGAVSRLHAHHVAALVEALQHHTGSLGDRTLGGAPTGRIAPFSLLSDVASDIVDERQHQRCPVNVCRYANSPKSNQTASSANEMV